MDRKTLILSASEVLSCLDLDETFRVVEETFREAGLGRTILRPKLFMYLPGEGHGDFMFAGPASVPSAKAVGVKIVTGYKANPERFGLPHILALMILTDPENGYPLAVFDGTHLTTFRTGAMTAVTAKYLANPDSGVLAVIGAGTQGRSTAKALSRIFALREIHLYDLDSRAGEKYREEMALLLNLPVRLCSHAKEAVEGADLIVTVTSAEGEFVRNEWVKPGAFIASVGSYPELDPALPKKVEKLVVDDRTQARYRGELWKGYERGEFKDGMIYAELGEIVSGRKKGRETRDERTLACLTGVGTLDVAVARRIYETALARNLGSWVNLW
ncbi:MAG: ornithine cyclodeaminase family protein [Deltaproteobacteria bacterium]|nr:ornithine cyclodeaminase family protein [Deltaproteobacteria bacterium]